jgi:hypothetical protein
LVVDENHQNLASDLTDKSVGDTIVLAGLSSKIQGLKPSWGMVSTTAILFIGQVSQQKTKAAVSVCVLNIMTGWVSVSVKMA